MNVLNSDLFEVQLPKYQGVTLRESTINRLSVLNTGQTIDAIINTVLDERERKGASN